MGDLFNRSSGEGMRTPPDYGETAPGPVRAMYKPEEFSEGSGLERTLLELVKTRV